MFIYHYQPELIDAADIMKQISCLFAQAILITF